ncbi:MAG: serine/threonine-protein kinase [bacterium]
MSELNDAPSAQENLIGRTLDNGRYEIVKLIGEGGMGRVYQARQTSMDRMVALKILRAQLALDEQLLARFQQEALSVSKLRHPNTITVYDYGRTPDGLLFIAMELLGGKSLYQLLRQKRRLSLRRSMHILGQVAGAVAEAHQLGVVHRDLKPENIQIDKVGGDPWFAKVLDFGIAKIVHGEAGPSEGKTLTMAGAIFGTPAYMSPEQVHGEKVDHRTDIYSLGIILYELLSGQQPFTGATPMSIMMAQASKEVPPIRDICPEADVNDGVLRILDRCLAKDRDQRFSSAVELQRAFQSVQVDIGDISRSQMLVREPQWASETLDAPRPDRRPSSSMERAVAERLGPDERSAMASAPTLTPPDEDTGTGHAAGQVSTMPPEAMTDEVVALAPGRGWRFAALGIVLAAGGGLAVWRPWQGPEPVEPRAVIDITDASVPTQELLTYHIESAPPGALVFDGDVELGPTPVTSQWRRGLRQQLRFELAGYHTQNAGSAGRGGRRADAEGRPGGHPEAGRALQAGDHAPGRPGLRG